MTDPRREWLGEAEQVVLSLSDVLAAGKWLLEDSRARLSDRIALAQSVSRMEAALEDLHITVTEELGKR